jgi:hypothetical protein
MKNNFFERRKTVDIASFVKQSDILLRDPKRVKLASIKPYIRSPTGGLVSNTKASLNTIDSSPEALKKLYLKARDLVMREVHKNI